MRMALMLLCLSALLMGCGGSLRGYFVNAHNYYSNVSALPHVSVEIETAEVPGGNIFTKTGRIIHGVNMATSIASSVVGSEQQKRLQSLVNSKDIASGIQKTFNSTFTAQTQLPVTTGDADVRILLTVRAYGVHADDSGDEMSFYLNTQVRVIEVATLKTIYDDVISIYYPVSQFGVGGPVGSVYNLVSFCLLSDQEIRAVFDSMASTSGIEIANELIREIYG